MTEETTIDWSAPLEAVHRKTRQRRAIQVPATDYNEDPETEGSFAVRDDFIGIFNCFDKFGNSEDPDKCLWDIRNRKPTASEHPEYSPELVGRLRSMRNHLSLARNRLRVTAVNWAGLNRVRSNEASHWAHEADEHVENFDAILSELDKSKEVDPLVEGFNCLPPVWDEAIFTKSLRGTFDRLGYELRKKDEAA